MTQPPEIFPCETLKTSEHTTSRKLASGSAAVALWALSGVALALAVFTAIVHITLHLIHHFQPNLLPWTLKSAIPLILIGIAFASLQFILPRTNLQILLGLMVAVAFILWGTEQFLSNQAIVSFIDAIVVLLFVIDLSIVIHGHLKPAVHSIGKNLPFDETGE